MINELIKSIKEKQVILFVGAGIPATIGLPTWSQLIGHVAEDLGYDKQIFNQYGDSLQLAEYYQCIKGNLTELLNWMKSNWKIDDEMIKKSEIYKLIVELQCPIIYTTNYENSLESAFRINKKAYKSIKCVDDLVKLDNNVTQIVKFHGDLSLEESIVLTESSYFERLDFESPLDIKLRSDMLGKSILFLGYSLSDINMRMLIYKLDKLWKKSNDSAKRPQSYLFMPTPNPVQEEIFLRRGICTITGTCLDKKESTIEFLNKLVSGATA